MPRQVSPDRNADLDVDDLEVNIQPAKVFKRAVVAAQVNEVGLDDSYDHSLISPRYQDAGVNQSQPRSTITSHRCRYFAKEIAPGRQVDQLLDKRVSADGVIQLVDWLSINAVSFGSDEKELHAFLLRVLGAQGGRHREW